MKFMLYLSDLMIPFLLFGIIGFGLLSGRDVYQDFLDGAREGLKTIASICPTLIGLMTAVGVLRASGLLKYMGDFLGKILSPLGIPGDIVPLALVRLFSSSAAASLLLDIFKEYGTESTTGFMAAIILSATESVFWHDKGEENSLHLSWSTFCYGCRDNGCYLDRKLKRLLVHLSVNFQNQFQNTFCAVL